MKRPDFAVTQEPPMSSSARSRIVRLVIASGIVLSGCMSSVVDSSSPAPRVDTLAGTWRVLGPDSGFQYQFLDSTRMVVQRPTSSAATPSVQIDTMPIAFEPGGFFFDWRYKGQIGRQYCFRKGDTLIFGVAAGGDHQTVYPRVAHSWRSKINPAFGQWESIVCPSIFCLLDTLVIDSNSTMYSKTDREKNGTDPYPLEFQDEVLTISQPTSGVKVPLVHLVRNDTLSNLEGGVQCASDADTCLPNGRRKLLRR
jgi:hypothetical protein